MKSFKLFLALFGLLWFSSVAQANESQTVYKLGFPHTCDTKLGYCAYKHFLTTRNELNEDNDLIFYLSIDPRTKSRIMEITTENEPYSITPVIINFNRSIYKGALSAAVYIRIDCKKNKYQPMGITYFSDYFTKGTDIINTSLDREWEKPIKAYDKSSCLSDMYLLGVVK